MSRERERMSLCHCEERSDEAIQSSMCGLGLLRFARNDELGCIRSPHERSDMRECLPRMSLRSSGLQRLRGALLRPAPRLATAEHADAAFDAQRICARERDMTDVAAAVVGV